MSINNPQDLISPDWRTERLVAIKRLYPDLFTDEGVINIDEIHALAHDYDLSLGEKFEFRWPGKMQAKKNAFTSSKARLAPQVDRSVNFDETKNVIIEGENLEVLKLLSKAYYNKVKCIYIDPPYNTGHDFVYSDDYSEGKQAYWEKNGVFHDGLKVDTNSESAGRYHTNWLNMMMPRLLLAQMMLKDDGVIFVSIDDHEVHNLRKLMDEVFGEENFVASIVWQKKYAASNDASGIAAMHDYIVVYQKSEQFRRKLLPRTTQQDAAYKNDDNDGRGLWRSDNLLVKSFSSSGVFPITNPNTGKEYLPKSGNSWRASEETAKKWLQEGRIFFGKDGKGAPQLKRYLNEVQQGSVPTTWWTYEEGGHNDQANKELQQLFGDAKVPFDTPKPTKLIKRILQIAMEKDGIVLDFFAGSGTTGHAVMELNSEDDGNRSFVLIQIPEATEEGGAANNTGYKKISEITLERVKRAGERVHTEKPEIDTGFKVFKLTTSIFPENTYQPDPEKSAEENVAALKEHIARAKQQLMFDPKGKETDLMYETLIKQGFMLTMTKERLEEFKENAVWKVTDGDRSAIVCLDAELKDTTVKALVRYKDSRFIGLHRAVDTTKKWELTQTFGEALVLI